MSAVMTLSSLCLMVGKLHAMVTAESLVNVELLSTSARCRQLFWLPTISEAQSISKCLFVEAETVFFQWKDV